MTVIVHLTTQEFDIFGHVILDVPPNQLKRKLTRRVNRVPVLDGGVDVDDRGFSHGDRDFDLSWRPVSKAHNDSVQRLVELYGRLVFSGPEGVFLVAPFNFDPDESESSLTLYVIEKLSE